MLVKNQKFVGSKESLSRDLLLKLLLFSLHEALVVFLLLLEVRHNMPAWRSHLVEELGDIDGFIIWQRVAWVPTT